MEFEVTHVCRANHGTAAACPRIRFCKLFFTDTVLDRAIGWLAARINECGTPYRKALSQTFQRPRLAARGLYLDMESARIEVWLGNVEKSLEEASQA